MGESTNPPLRPWQLAALTEWRANQHRGIVAAATGTGKTRVALEAIRTLPDAWVTVVVVPTKALQEQWIDVLTQQLRIHPRNVGTIGGESPNYALGQRIVVAVLNSAKDRVPSLVDHWREEGIRTLLIVDECHRAGAPETAKALWATSYDATLGLSATPERGDDGLDEVLIPAIGSVVYRYPLREALDDGLLSPLCVANLYLDLGELEMQEFTELERKIRTLLTQGGSEGDANIKRLRSQQQQVSRRAAGRHVALEGLVSGGLLDGRRTIVFHETIAQAEETARLLDERGYRFAIEHSKLSADARASALRRFATGGAEVLATVRSLDEGIDVPEANTAVIVSGTMNPRQRIQRAGRIVRPSGSTSLLVSLLARGTPEELEVGGRDAALFGSSRVNHIANWDRRDPRTLVEFLRSLVSEEG